MALHKVILFFSILLQCLYVYGDDFNFKDNFNKETSQILKCIKSFRKSFQASKERSGGVEIDSRVTDSDKKFSYGPNKDFLFFDKTLQSGKIRRTFITEYGEFGCTFDKEYQKTVYVKYTHLITKAEIFKSKPGIINYNNHISCKKHNGASSEWEELTDLYSSSISSAYSIDLELEKRKRPGKPRPHLKPEKYLNDFVSPKGTCDDVGKSKHKQVLQLPKVLGIFKDRYPADIFTKPENNTIQ